MKKIHRTALGLALLVALAGGGVSASAKNASRPRALNGVVRSIDLGARTVEVRERKTGQLYTVRVPEGKLLRTSSASQPLMQLERLLVGMTITAGVE